MPRNILYKLGLIAAVAAFSFFLSYPPQERINLGLDLRGGIHLVLDVMVDEAVAGEVRSDYGDLLELLQNEAVAPASSALDGGTGFTLTFDTMAARDQAEAVAAEYFPTYTSGVSGNPPSLSLSLGLAEQATIRENAVRQARQTIENRINQYGVAEPVIQRQGRGGTRILV